jgi:hypothetical protein
MGCGGCGKGNKIFKFKKEIKEKRDRGENIDYTQYPDEALTERQRRIKKRSIRIDARNRRIRIREKRKAREEARKKKEV